MSRGFKMEPGDQKDVRHILTRQNHEFLKWAKTQIFHGLYENTVFKVIDFCLPLVLSLVINHVSLAKTSFYFQLQLILKICISFLCL